MSSEILDSVMRALCYPVAGGILLNGLDDLFVDANYYLRGLHRRHARIVSPEELRQSSGKRVAILLPAWHESEVIETMLTHNLERIDYAKESYVIFCGTYKNDPETQACVDRVARTSSSVCKVVVPHDGPTSKADCLNWIYQGILLEEERRGVRFDILAMHDAEDVIHPLMLRLYGLFIPRYDFVQTPVFSLPVAAKSIVAGTYIDEFAEHHLKDMLVRQAIGGLIPSAGVGSAFERGAFEEVARQHGQHPFNPESLTEDYEIGVKFRLANRKVAFACRTVLETPDLEKAAASGSRPFAGRGREEYIATREYFPDTFTASIRQRSRWICGIALQTWRQIGWKGSLPVLYCLWRDRKAVANNTLLSLAYALVLYFVSRSLLAGLMSSAWDYGQVVPSRSLLALVLELNLWMLVWRAWVKGSLVGRLYGTLHGILSMPRLVVGNAISLAAMTRAIWQYTHHILTGKPLRWLKTTHAFPNVAVLKAQTFAQPENSGAGLAVARVGVDGLVAGGLNRPFLREVSSTRSREESDDPRGE